MSELFLWIFISICIGILGWGMLRADRVYQFPFFMSAIFLSFILPQAFALIENPGAARPEAIDRVLFMSCLCAGMCWLGYLPKPNPKFLEKLAISVDEHKLFRVGIAMTVFCYALRGALASAIRVVNAAGKGDQWSGPVTIVAFFYSIIFIAFAIVLLHAVKYPQFRNILMAIISSYPILELVFGGGRRQTAAAFFLAVGLGFFYKRRYVPPRILALALVIATVYLIPIVGAERGAFWAKAFLFRLDLVDWSRGLDEVIKGSILELRNAAILMDASQHTGQYGYGTGYWDNFIFRYVPGQIIGQDAKSALQFNLIDRNLLESFDYSLPTGSTNTGIGDSFMEFSYFGSLFFFIEAYIFKHLWVAGTENKHVIIQILYIGLISAAMLSVTHGTVNFIPDVLFQAIFLGVAVILSKPSMSKALDSSKSIPREESKHTL